MVPFHVFPSRTGLLCPSLPSLRRCRIPSVQRLRLPCRRIFRLSLSGQPGMPMPRITSPCPGANAPAVGVLSFCPLRSTSGSSILPLFLSRPSGGRRERPRGLCGRLCRPVIRMARPSGFSALLLCLARPDLQRPGGTFQSVR